MLSSVACQCWSSSEERQKNVRICRENLSCQDFRTKNISKPTTFCVEPYSGSLTDRLLTKNVNNIDSSNRAGSIVQCSHASQSGLRYFTCGGSPATVPDPAPQSSASGFVRESSGFVGEC